MSDAERKPEGMGQASSEVLRMMEGYHTNPLREVLRNSPWVIISVILHVGFVILALYITWEGSLPKEEVVLRPEMKERVIPVPPIMIPPRPQDTKQSVTKNAVVPEEMKISQAILPLPDDLFRKDRPNIDAPSLLLTTGQNPVPVGQIGGGDTALASGAGDATMGVLETDILSKGRLLVVWLFDESPSMKDDQEAIRDRVDELYKKMERMSVLRGASMQVVTAVASFGKDTHVLISEPTEKVDDIRKAIDQVQVDESGDENFLKAINTVLTAFEPYAQRYKRRIVIILVTDEGGDDDDAKIGDDAILEQTVARLKATKSSVLVFGKLGGFYRETTGERLPDGKSVVVDRGRDTGIDEVLPLDYPFTNWWFVNGGFGAYPYARLTHETGGMMFLLNAMTGTYDYEKLLDGYEPEVVSRAELLVRDRKNALRSAIRQCLTEWAEMEKKTRVNGYFHEAQLNAELEAGQKGGQAVIEFCNTWIPRLESMANVTVPDSPKRWEANRQFLVAQLYKRRYIAKGYLDLLRRLAVKENIPAPGEFGWYISFYGAPPEAGTDAARELAVVKAKYQEIVEKQAGTPWAEYARHEVLSLGGGHVLPHSQGQAPDKG